MHQSHILSFVCLLFFYYLLFFKFYQHNTRKISMYRIIVYIINHLIFIVRKYCASCEEKFDEGYCNKCFEKLSPFLCGICQGRVKGDFKFHLILFIQVSINLFQSSSCTFLLLDYFLCLKSKLISGLIFVCEYCHHGGHIEHILEWFKQNTYCPTGCGCECIVVYL